MRYKKFECIQCSHIWMGFASKPRCRKCNSRKINIYPGIIEEQELKKLETTKIQQDETITQETQEDHVHDQTQLENIPIENEKEEVAQLICGDCKNLVTRGDLFCYNCGSSLDWGED